MDETNLEVTPVEKKVAVFENSALGSFFAQTLQIKQNKNKMASKKIRLLRRWQQHQLVFVGVNYFADCH